MVSLAIGIKIFVFMSVGHRECDHFWPGHYWAAEVPLSTVEPTEVGQRMEREVKALFSQSTLSICAIRSQCNNSDYRIFNMWTWLIRSPILNLQVKMGKLFRGLLGTVTLFSLPILLLHIRPTAKNSNKSPTTANSTVNSTTSEDIRPNNPLVDSPNISFASSQIREQRWKKRQTLQTCLCYFS